MKNIRKNIEIRRFLEWSKIVRGKPIQIRLYELIYFELLELWLQLNKPPLRRLIYETINSDDYNDKFVLTPYYRFYFLQSEDFGGYGIFAEVFTQFTSHKIAPGLAVGRKWINRKGFTFELLAGFGRNLLFDSDDEVYSDHTEGVVRAGISIGKRF